MTELDMGLLLLGVVGAFVFAGTNIWLVVPPLKRTPAIERIWRQRRTP
ncbi:hypothetical protein DNFV4_00093 [Nitrospira tepida]|uniref:Uncharacterized protein n=1 Tax=Nitrospira tepida TaxID=2973512 RepID=A0AA86T0P7_9BACT|nr:hypothetical protein [Nitrospira tepida]CAI4029675.1 hypothetical protein DNFV4_00093 [Nitrospira tepida]